MTDLVDGVGRRLPWAIPPLCLVVLWYRRAELLWTRADFAPHFEYFLVPALARIDRGELWVPGPELADTGIHPGGPLYYWAHLPARLLRDPVLAIQTYYFALEGAALLLWMGLCHRAGVRRQGEHRQRDDCAAGWGCATARACAGRWCGPAGCSSPCTPTRSSWCAKT